MKKTLQNISAKLFLSCAMLIGPNLGAAHSDLQDTIAETGLSGSFLASRVAIGDNDDGVALKFLKRAIALDPENVEISRDLFISLVANGQIDEAAAIVKEVEAIALKNNLASIVKAVQAIRERSWNNADENLGVIEGSDLDKLLREISISWSTFGAGKADDALDRLEKIEGPDWAKVIRDYHAGLMAAIVGGRDEYSIDKFQSVIDNRGVVSVLTETYLRSIESIVRIKSKLEDKQAAKDSLKYGLSIAPSHPPFQNLSIQLDAGEAIAPLIKSPQEGVSELFYNVATALQRDGGSRISKSYLQLADYLHPGSDSIKIAVAELFLQEGNYELSNQYYDSIGEQSPFKRIALLEHATNLSRLEKTEEAIEEMRQLIADEPDDLAGYMTLGGLFSREKRYSEAAEVYEKAIGFVGTPERQHWNLFFRRGIAYERIKEWSKAEPSFTKSLELSPNQAEVLNYLGYSWIDQGINLEKGLELIRKAVELRPSSGFIVDSLGWAHYRIGEFDEAVIELERAVALMPQDPTINDHLGDAYWRVGRKLEATFQWKIALAAKDPEHDDPASVELKLKEGLGPVETTAQNSE